MERIDLFSVGIYKTKVQLETSYKNYLMKTIEENYKIDACRTPPSDKINRVNTNFHTYQDNFENEKFKKIDFTTLHKNYDKIFEGFFQQLPISDNNYKYIWHLINLNVGVNGYLEKHHHREFRKNDDNETYTCQFTSVHYLSFDSKCHSPNIFCNPTNIPEYLDISCLTTKLKSDDLKNSIYYGNWELPIEEDDIFIFPSYLSHYVSTHDKPNNENKLRVMLACNISMNVSPFDLFV
jgi:hypothetical protein